MRGMRSAAKQPEPAKRAEATNLAQTLAMLWPYLWQFKYRVLLALLALIAAKAAVLLMPVALKHIVDALDTGQQPLLAVDVDFRQQDVPAVAQQGCVVQFLRHDAKMAANAAISLDLDSGFILPHPCG